MERSCFTLDLGAIRRNAATLLRAAERRRLWAVVKAEGYGHGAVDVSRAALDAGATALCVATLPEALHLRAALRNARILVMGPVSEREIGEARGARLGLVAAGERIPEGVRVHLKVDTGMGRWGVAASPPTRDVVGPDEPSRIRGGGSGLHAAPGRALSRSTAGAGSLTRHLANSAAVLRFAEARVRRGSVRDRPLRHLAVRLRPRRRRARAGVALGVLCRARQEARAGGEHGLRAALVADRRRGSASSRSAMQTAFVAT